MSDRGANGRLEAFCDGVFAIALTLLIIDVRIPPADQIASGKALWVALRGVVPSVLSVTLSFLVIFISWVNHHVMLKLVDKASAPFIYANGFLLLTVVLLPFPTALLGDYLFTDRASPAVVLYNAALALQALGWVLMGGAAVNGGLTRNPAAASAMQVGNRNGYFALGLYTVLAVAALWFPRTVTAITASTWVFWLIFGLNTHDKAAND